MFTQLWCKRSLLSPGGSGGCWAAEGAGGARAASDSLGPRNRAPRDSSSSSHGDMNPAKKEDRTCRGRQVLVSFMRAWYWVKLWI
jgi:hypothetical protein